jgi:predicted TIM-barrel fold metal-dependent hydrolase
MLQLRPFHRLLSAHALHDLLGSIVLDGVFQRFPGVRIVSVELGSKWVAPLLSAMDEAVTGFIGDAWSGPPPSEVFARNVWVNPYEHEDISALVQLIGIDRICMGSDYPHPEGIGGPGAYRDGLPEFSETQIRQVMRENTAGLLRLS